VTRRRGGGETTSANDKIAIVAWRRRLASRKSIGSSLKRMKKKKSKNRHRLAVRGALCISPAAIGAALSRRKMARRGIGAEAAKRATNVKQTCGIGGAHRRHVTAAAARRHRCAACKPAAANKRNDASAASTAAGGIARPARREKSKASRKMTANGGENAGASRYRRARHLSAQTRVISANNLDKNASRKHGAKIKRGAGMALSARHRHGGKRERRRARHLR